MKFSRLVTIISGSVFIAAWAFASLAMAEKFLSDDPLEVDPDQQPTEMPSEREISQIADFIINTFGTRPKPDEEPIPPAENVNTLGEVPNSSWFTNRIGQHLMTLDELRKGPNQLEGSSLIPPFTITSAKSEGITPGFFARDSRGIRYLIKFDPQEYPQLATSAEVISTKFFHAFGYHVPENYLLHVQESDFVIGSDAEIDLGGGETRSMVDSDLKKILDRVPRHSDGTIQLVASRLISGRALGGFKYYGTRTDDPNDIIPHQHRRELRGLRVLSAWLNHDDSRSINTLDVYVGNSPEGAVRHYLIDFGSTLGSGSVKPQTKRAGNEYMLEWPPIFKAAATFGIWDRPWRSIRYPYVDRIGRFEADHFHPHHWKPEYPNPAFERMLPADSLWATRIVMQFSDEMIREIVKTGELEYKEVEDYLIETLIRRRDKIIHYYLSETNPLIDFRLDFNELSFSNPGIEEGLAEEASYRYQWHAFDNEQETSSVLGAVQITKETALEVPQHDGPYLMVQLETLCNERPGWQSPVRVYLRRTSGWEIVGIERSDEFRE